MYTTLIRNLALFCSCVADFHVEGYVEVETCNRHIPKGQIFHYNVTNLIHINFHKHFIVS
jgi:hypothetical protein